ncbi:MAG: hypothetical protein V1926_05775 [Candidatus Peregrinibacteria bacterium]
MQQRTIQTLSILLFLALIIWGGIVAIIYLGIPVHGIVLLKDEAYKALAGVCIGGSSLCKGFFSIAPFLENALGRAEPFLWYAIVSALLYGVFLGVQFLRRGHLSNVSWRIAPWHLVLFFVGSLWLIFTCFSLTLNDGSVQIRYMVEPTAAVYKGTGEEGLKVLQANFADLQQRGCLTDAGGTFSNGGKAFLLSNRCMQQSFMTRVLPPLGIILLLLAEFLVLGRMILKGMRLRSESQLLETILSFGMGASGFVVLLWLFAVLSVHIPGLRLISNWGGWTLLILVPLIGYRSVLFWWRRFLSVTLEREARWHDMTVLLGWLLITYLAFNFLTVVRPFPIGWDDLGSYLNRPRLMVSYGHFIYSMATFQWEYLTALGFMLFGYQSVFGATVSMLINWMAGFLAVCLVFAFGNTFLGKGRGVLASLLYYALPMVGHFSYADMKIDNAVFLMGGLCVLSVFVALFPFSDREPVAGRAAYPWLAAAGIFGGMAFAFKVPAIMIVLAVGTVLVGALLHWSAFLGALLAATAILSWQGLSVSAIWERIAQSPAPTLVGLVPVFLALPAAVLIGAAFLLRRDRVRMTLVAVSIFTGAFILSLAPWIAHNNFLWGKFAALSLGAPNNIMHVLDTAGTSDPTIPSCSPDLAPGIQCVHRLPEELRFQKSGPNCVSTAGTEELGRYWGDRKGIGHYLMLPWRAVMNIDAAGYYMTTMPALLLIPLVFLLPFFWTPRGRWLKWMTLASLFMLLEWTFAASGIIWYGVGMFLGFVLILESLVARSPDLLNRAVVVILIGFSVMSMFSMRLWQFSQQKNLFEYPMGKASAEVMIERTIPHYNDIADLVLQRNQEMPDRPLLYRIGTFIPYFIPRNLEVIGIADHQLDFFNCLYQERDPELAIRRLSALGFNSIIFDTNTATIEKDPNGTLHTKVNLFVDFMNTLSAKGLVRILISDTNAGVAFAEILP